MKFRNCIQDAKMSSFTSVFCFDIMYDALSLPEIQQDNVVWCGSPSINKTSKKNIMDCKNNLLIKNGSTINLLQTVILI